MNELEEILQILEKGSEYEYDLLIEYEYLSREMSKLKECALILREKLS